FAAPEQATFSSVVAASGGGVAAGVATLLSILFSLNLVLGVFNLIPLPPLDGSAALALVLPDRWRRVWLDFLRQPMLSWAGLLLAWRLFPPLFAPLHTLALNLLWPGFLYR
ncbi:MAG: hypothetical protein F9K18_12515, partial [Thermoanaerobaculia bacterium]